MHWWIVYTVILALLVFFVVFVLVQGSLKQYSPSITNRSLLDTLDPNENFTDANLHKKFKQTTGSLGKKWKKMNNNVPNRASVLDTLDPHEHFTDDNLKTRFRRTTKSLTKRAKAVF
jgi:hypothetical protein